MNIPFKMIYIIVLVQSESAAVSSKNTSGDDDCNHPSKKDFGLVKNGSVRESLKTLPKIIAGFLSINNSGQEDITFTLRDCIRSQDCRIYTMLDKKKENSLTLCVVVNETKNCFVSTCTCPNSRTRRGINSHFITPNPSSGPQEATCKLELIFSENISDNRHGNMTNIKDEKYEHPLECTTLKCETKKNTMKNKVLVQIECSAVSSKNTPADTTCNHPSKTDFGLIMNGTVRESLKTLPKIIAGFLSINNSGQEDITFNLRDCIRSQDCRVYTILDKQKENTMTLCVVVNETKNCFVSTCTCSNSRTRRGVNSHLLTPNTSSGPQEATCNFELLLSENISDNLHENMTTLRDERSENPMDCTTHQFETKLNTLQNISEQSKLTADGNNNWVYTLFIGFGVGAFIGSLATFLWFKRKASMPKILSVLNAVYKSENSGDEKLYLQNVTEYSEIPDCTIKFGSKEQEDHLQKARGSPKHDTRTKFHAPPSLVVHDNTFEQSFQKEDKDERVHTNDKGLAKTQGLVSSRSSDNSDIQQEKECYINNGIEQDTYEIPSNRTDVTYSPDTIQEYPRGKNDVDLSTKDEEDETVETNRVRMKNLNSNATYFVLSADGNKTEH